MSLVPQRTSDDRTLVPVGEMGVVNEHRQITFLQILAQNHPASRNGQNSQSCADPVSTHNKPIIVANLSSTRRLCTKYL